MATWTLHKGIQSLPWDQWKHLYISSAVSGYKGKLSKDSVALSQLKNCNCFQIFQNPMHLYRACCFMEWCAVERPGTELHRPDRPASLFEGLVGRLFLAEEMCHAMDAKFPGLTV